MVTIEMPYQTVERVSRSRVTLATPPITKNELQEVIMPMSDEELRTNYVTKTNVNMNYLP